MSKKQNNIITTMLLIVGITLLFYPYIKMTILTQKTSRIKYVYDKSIAEESKQLFDLSKLQAPNMKQILEMNSSTNFSSVLSLLPLDKRLPVSNDTSSTSFLTGGVNMYPTRDPMRDNLVILGHHLSDRDLLFGNISKLKQRDELILTTPTHEYMYEITEVYITDEKNVSVLSPTTKPKMTLITCDQPNYTKKRLIVDADLIHYKETSDRQMKRIDYFQNNELVDKPTILNSNKGSKSLWLMSLYIILTWLIIKLFLINS